MSTIRKASFEAPRRASASHLIHLIGIDQIKEELAKQQKAKAEGILEVITATSISRSAPPTKRELEMMNVAFQMHKSGEINDLVWSQIRAIFVYLGAPKDNSGCLLLETISFPDNWDPAQDLSFAKRLLPKFLQYQLEQYQELGASIDAILDKAGALKTTPKKEEMSEEQIQRAEELANWNQIKDSTDKRDFQNFLKRYKGGAYERLAYIKLEELVWQELGPVPNYQSLHRFLQSFPYGRHADEAKSLIQKMAAAAASRRAQPQYQQFKPQYTEKKKKSRLKPVLKFLLKALAVILTAVGNVVIYLLKLLFSSGKKNNNRVDVVRPPKKNKKSKSQASSTTLLKSLAAGVFVSLVCVGLLLAPVWKQNTNGKVISTAGKEKAVSTSSNTVGTKGEKAIRTFIGHTKSLKAVAFLPNGKQAISASADRTLKLWNLNTGQVVRTFTGHADTVSAVAISPDGKTVLSGSHDNTVKLWDIASGNLLHTFQGHKDWVVSVAFSEDGHLILSGGHDKTIRLWHTSSGKLLRTFEGHKDWVVAVSFVSETNAIISGSHDSTVRLWDLGTGKQVRTFEGHKHWVTSLNAFKSNLTALSGSFDKTVKIWNMRTGEAIRSFNTSGVRTIALIPGEKMVIVGNVDRKLTLWNIESGQKIRTFRGHNSERVNSVAVSPDGQYALSGGEDKTLKLWKLKSL